MATIYSVRFYARKGLPPGTSDFFSIPVGYVGVIRDIDLYCSAGASNADIFIEGAFTQTIFRAEVVALTQDSPQWRGRQILNEGEQCTINNVSASPWDVTISGYLLLKP